ncbi:hypothetical protein KJ780_01075, partial [Candidatus Micrarchaeota archaeon]|nr:hypothetical protein [Candidatus Micrarchaeota archaeon]
MNIHFSNRASAEHFLKRKLSTYKLKPDQFHESVIKGLKFAFRDFESPFTLITYSRKRMISCSEALARAGLYDGDGFVTVYLPAILDNMFKVSPFRENYRILLESLFVHEGDHMVKLMHGFHSGEDGSVQRALFEGFATLTQYYYLLLHLDEEKALGLLIKLNEDYFKYF